MIHGQHFWRNGSESDCVWFQVSYEHHGLALTPLIKHTESSDIYTHIKRLDAVKVKILSLILAVSMKMDSPSQTSVKAKNRHKIFLTLALFQIFENHIYYRHCYSIINMGFTTLLSFVQYQSNT